MSISAVRMGLPDVPTVPAVATKLVLVLLALVLMPRSGVFPAAPALLLGELLLGLAATAKGDTGTAGLRALMVLSSVLAAFMEVV
jgi:hypothetical protein